MVASTPRSPAFFEEVGIAAPRPEDTCVQSQAGKPRYLLGLRKTMVQKKCQILTQDKSFWLMLASTPRSPAFFEEVGIAVPDGTPVQFQAGKPRYLA